MCSRLKPYKCPRSPHRSESEQAKFWRPAAHRFEVSLSEIAAVFLFSVFLELCHTHVYMTLRSLSSEHIFEKGKSGSGFHRLRQVSKDFPFPKALPFELGQKLPPGLIFLLGMIA